MTSKGQQSPQRLKRQPAFCRLDKSNNVFFIGSFALILLFIVASLFYIGTHVKVVDIGYQIDQDLNHKQKLIESNKLLKLEIAELTSPTRLEAEAKEKVGLTLPNADQVVYASKFKESALYARLMTAPAPAVKSAVASKEIAPTPKPSAPKLAPSNTRKIEKTLAKNPQAKKPEAVAKKAVAKTPLVAKKPTAAIIAKAPKKTSPKPLPDKAEKLDRGLRVASTREIKPEAKALKAPQNSKKNRESVPAVMVSTTR